MSRLRVRWLDRSIRCTLFLLHAWGPTIAHCEGGLELSPGLVWLIYYSSWRTVNENLQLTTPKVQDVQNHINSVFFSAQLLSRESNRKDAEHVDWAHIWMSEALHGVTLQYCLTAWCSIAPCVQFSIHLDLDSVSEPLRTRGIKIETKSPCKGDFTLCKGKKG